MSIEAMKLALEALEEFCEHGAMLKPIERRDALRQAIAEAEKQTFTYAQMKEHSEGMQRDYDLLLAEFKLLKQEAEKQEPVGWIDSKGNMICTKINESCKPLYTTPQQRTWVGLTYEDMVSLQKDLHDSNGEIVLPTTFAKAIEAKLKEKNT
jgi:hypothetical protein